VHVDPAVQLIGFADRAQDGFYGLFCGHLTIFVGEC
jgi:hypothetical protein